MQIDLKKQLQPERAGRVRVLFSLALLFFMAGAPIAHAASHRHRAPKQVVHRIASLERKWQAAQLDANVAVMASMLAEDYVGISPDGTLNSKTETLASFKNGTIHFTSLSTDDQKIRVYGSTAVVVSKDQVAGTHNGVEFHGAYRYTRVYHLNGTSWQIVSFEASRMRDRAKPAGKLGKKL